MELIRVPYKAELDNRVAVRNAAENPFLGVWAIRSQKGWGSGFFIAPHLFLTNAHCVSGEPNDIRICKPTKAGTATSSHSWIPKEIHVHPQYREDKFTTKHDVALLLFEDNLVSVDDCFLLHPTFLVDTARTVGFPGDKSDPQERKMYTSHGRLEQDQEEVWVLRSFTFPGQSGSPVFHDNKVAVGICCHARCGLRTHESGDIYYEITGNAIVAIDEELLKFVNQFS